MTSCNCIEPQLCLKKTRLGTQQAHTPSWRSRLFPPRGCCLRCSAWQVGIRAQASAGPPSCQRLSPGRGSSCNEAVRGVFVQIGRTRGGEGAREPRSSWQNKSSWTDRSCWVGFFSLSACREAPRSQTSSAAHACLFLLSLSLSFSITYFLFSIIFPSAQRGEFYKSDCFTEPLALQVCWTVKGTVHIHTLFDGKVEVL